MTDYGLFYHIFSVSIRSAGPTGQGRGEEHMGGESTGVLDGYFNKDQYHAHRLSALFKGS